MPLSSSLRSAQIIAVLSVTQLIGWGTTFSMLGVLGRVIAPDLEFSNEIVFAGLTVMMVVSALAGPTTGRLLARHGAARVLSASSVILAAGMLLLSASTGIVLYALAWIALGIGGALGLSAPAYAAVVEREGLGAKRTIAILMLFTGLSSTVFWPVLSVLNADIGWRATFIVCAAAHLLICLPLHLFCLPNPQAGSEKDKGARTAAPLPLTPRASRLAFIFVAAATTVSTFVTFGLSTTLIEVLRQSGAAPDIALKLGSALGAVGMSARLMDMVLGRRGNPILSAVIGLGMMIASVILLLSGAPALSALVVFVLVYGFGSGVMAVARTLLPLALFSPADYGLQAARLSLPQNLANALAPVALTAALDHVGAGPTMLICGGLIALAFLFIMALLVVVRGATRAAVPAPAIP